jgi:CRP-like cAMP-binding protein
MSTGVRLEGSPPPVEVLLGNIPIFGAIGDRALQQIHKLLKVHSFEAGAFVVHEGDTEKNVYIVERGEVEVLKTCTGLPPQMARIAVLGPGACFGEMALIDVLPRSASVRTTQRSVLWSFSNADLYYIYQWDLETFTLIMMNLARELSRRLRKADLLLAEAAPTPHPA